MSTNAFCRALFFFFFNNVCQFSSLESLLSLNSRLSITNEWVFMNRTSIKLDSWGGLLWVKSCLFANLKVHLSKFWTVDCWKSAVWIFFNFYYYFETYLFEGCGSFLIIDKEQGLPASLSALLIRRDKKGFHHEVNKFIFFFNVQELFAFMNLISIYTCKVISYNIGLLSSFCAWVTLKSNKAARDAFTACTWTLFYTQWNLSFIHSSFISDTIP